MPVILGKLIGMARWIREAPLGGIGSPLVAPNLEKMKNYEFILYTIK